MSRLKFLFISLLIFFTVLPVSQGGYNAVDYKLDVDFDGKANISAGARILNLRLSPLGYTHLDSATLKDFKVVCEEEFFDSPRLIIDEISYDVSEIVDANGRQEIFSKGLNVEFGLNDYNVEILADLNERSENRLVLCSLDTFVVEFKDGFTKSLGEGINNGRGKIERSIDNIDIFDNDYPVDSFALKNRNLSLNEMDQVVAEGYIESYEDVDFSSIHLRCFNGSLFDNLKVNINGAVYELYPQDHIFTFYDYNRNFDDYEEVEAIWRSFRNNDIDFSLKANTSVNFEIIADVNDVKYMDSLPRCGSSYLGYEFEGKKIDHWGLMDTSTFFYEYEDNFDYLNSNFTNKNAIDFLSNDGIVEGYQDGTFRSDKSINRAEFSKILAEAYLPKEELVSETCFDDVLREDWFSKYVCALKRKGFISGDSGKSTFRPADPVNFVESLKMVTEVLEFEIEPELVLNEVWGADGEWYDLYEIASIYNGYYSVGNIQTSTYEMLRGDAFVMLYSAIKSKEYDNRRNELVEAVNDLQDDMVIVSYNDQLGWRDYFLKCDIDSFEELSEVQYVYKELIDNDAHFHLKYRWDTLDKDGKNAFSLVSNYVGIDGTSVVPVIIKSGCVDILKKYEFESADQIDELFYDGTSYLSIHDAVISGNVDMVEYLVSLGADFSELITKQEWIPNKFASDFTLFSREGSSVLHLLADTYHDLDVKIEMADYLLDNGVELDLEDIKGRTALDVAEEHAFGYDSQPFESKDGYKFVDYLREKI